MQVVSTFARPYQRTPALADAKSELMGGIWRPLRFSGAALFLLTLAVNHVGDALRDGLDPKLRMD